MNEDLFAGDILDERDDLTLDELCQVCALETTHIVELVDEGILQPSGRERVSWRFSAVSVVTVKRSMRLRRDLGVNLPGVALALELMDEIERLQRRLDVSDRLTRGESPPPD